MKKKYAGAGVLLIVGEGKKDYIVLVKRTADAPVNPNTYSGFFGGTEKEDKNRPIVAANREFAEELFVINKQDKERFTIEVDVVEENIRGVSFIDAEGYKKVYVIKRSFNPNNYIFIDGEMHERKLLNRQIALFLLSDFIKWWKGEKGRVVSKFAFQSTKKIEPLTLAYRGQLSPSLLIMLNLYGLEL